VIPFNTILDQNADEIIAALDGYPVLEHHSGVTRDSEAEYTAHRRLTERGMKASSSPPWCSS
jgi:hypothetical protein